MKNTGFINISNNTAECKLALWGATLLSYCPKGEVHDVFWLGDLNKFDNAQAIRGGIPVCWPRFAAEKLNDNLPRHGFARISEWKVQGICADENMAEAVLQLVPDAKYNIRAAATLRIKIIDKLDYSLETVNLGEEPLVFAEALHCYFNISSIENISINGLQGCSYRSSLDGQKYTQEGALKINGEFDAAFLEHCGRTEIEDREYQRVIVIEKNGSKTTVVWNPAKDLAEMSAGQYKKFVCVEPSNVGDFAVCLQPGQTHKIGLKISVQKL